MVLTFNISMLYLKTTLSTPLTTTTVVLQTTTTGLAAVTATNQPKPKITQGCYSFVGTLSYGQLLAQLTDSLANNPGWEIEYTYDPHPRNTYWEMYGNPRFSSRDPQVALEELANCAGEYPNSYIKFLRYGNLRGTEACTMAFLYEFPEDEKGFKLIRQEEGGRNMRYTLERVS